MPRLDGVRLDLFNGQDRRPLRAAKLRRRLARMLVLIEIKVRVERTKV